MKIKAITTHLAAEAAELAVELERRDDPERARKAEAWRVKSDEPARQVKARHDLSLKAYVAACGYSADDVLDYLRAAMTASDGRDGLRRCADWRMGAYMSSYPAAEVSRLEAASEGDGEANREKTALAKRAQRAWAALDDEQRRTGLVSVRRKSGSLPGGKKRASEVDAVFVQRLVEIDREAKEMRGLRRLERYERAAAAVVGRLARDVRPSRAEERAASSHSCPSCVGSDGGSCPDREGGGRSVKGKTPASRAVRFLDRLGELAEGVVGGGGLPYEDRLVLYDSAMGLLAQKLGIDPADLDSVHPDLSIKRWTNSGPPGGGSDAPPANTVLQCPPENRDPDPSQLDVFVQLEAARDNHDPTGPAGSETALYGEDCERAYSRRRGDGLSDAEALADACHEVGTFDEWHVRRCRE